MSRFGLPVSRRHSLCIGILAAAAVYAPTAGADEFIQMSSVGLLPPPGATGQVLRANPQPASKWPSTFVFKGATATGHCTATAIGQRVILTAAHCVADAARGEVAVSATTKTTIVCNRHPDYSKNFEEDFSLCLAQSALPEPPGGFETVSNDLSILKVGDEVVLLGYGCVTDGNERSFGTLYGGEAAIELVPSKNTRYISTRGGAAVCFGDSGGGAYRILNASGSERRLVGVNSRGDINTVSLLAATATDPFLKWSSAWARQNGVTICGIDQGAVGCRQ